MQHWTPSRQVSVTAAVKNGNIKDRSTFLCHFAHRLTRRKDADRCGCGTVQEAFYWYWSFIWNYKWLYMSISENDGGVSLWDPLDLRWRRYHSYYLRVLVFFALYRPNGLGGQCVKVMFKCGRYRIRYLQTRTAEINLLCGSTKVGWFLPPGALEYVTIYECRRF